MKKIVSLIIILALCLTVGLPAGLAAEDGTVTIDVSQLSGDSSHIIKITSGGVSGHNDGEEIELFDTLIITGEASNVTIEVRGVPQGDIILKGLTITNDIAPVLNCIDEVVFKTEGDITLKGKDDSVINGACSLVSTDHGKLEIGSESTSANAPAIKDNGNGDIAISDFNNVTITNTKGSVFAGKNLTVQATEGVKIKANSKSPAIDSQGGAVIITAGSGIAIKNSGDDEEASSENGAVVSGAKDLVLKSEGTVEITGNYSGAPMITSSTEIIAAANVTITNSRGATVGGPALNIQSGGNVDIFGGKKDGMFAIAAGQINIEANSNITITDNSNIQLNYYDRAKLESSTGQVTFEFDGSEGMVVVPHSMWTQVYKADEGKVTVSPLGEDGKCTVTLDNATIQANDSCGIAFAEEDGLSSWDIILEGDNTVTSNSQEFPVIILSGASATISGNGSLEATGDIGIAAAGDLIVKSGDVTVSGEGVGISAGNVMVNGGTVDIEGSDNGIVANNVAVSGGTLTAEDSRIGIAANNSIEIKGGTVTMLSVQTEDLSVTGNGILDADTIFAKDVSELTGTINGIVIESGIDENGDPDAGNVIGTVYGTVKLKTDTATILASYLPTYDPDASIKLIIPEGSTLQIPDDAADVLKGDDLIPITNNGTLVVSEDAKKVLDITDNSTGEILNYFIYVEILPAGAGTVTGGGAVNAGEVTLTAEANNGYAFYKWLNEDGETVGEEEEYSFTVEANADLTAVFRRIPQLTLTASPAEAEAGSEVTLTLSGLPAGIRGIEVICDETGGSLTQPESDTTRWVVSLAETGVYNFTATFAGNDEYAPAEATCRVTVVSSGSEPDPGPGTDPEPGPGPEPGPDPEPTPEPDPEPEPEERPAATRPKRQPRTETSSKTSETTTQPAETETASEATVSPASRFNDLGRSQWYYEAVEFVLERGLMDGTNSGFAPDAPLSRAMLAQILWNHAGKPSAMVHSTFQDIPANEWYTGAVDWAADKGIVSGYSDGRFAPNDRITREQLAVMLWRYAGSPVGNGQLLFTDADSAGSYALEALRWAVAEGILSGKSGNRLDPTGSATRAEAAQMLKNYLSK